MKTPAALVCHLAGHLPAAWAVCAPPKPLRRRAYGARLPLGDCHLYVAATRRRVDVLAIHRAPVPGCPMLTMPPTVIFVQQDFLPADLLPTICAAARAVIALHPCDSPVWATETTP